MRRSLVVIVLACGTACARDQIPVDASYDPATGKLSRLAADLDKDGRIDTWTYMDGTTAVRTEQDVDGDGMIERWEFLGPSGAVVRIAESRRKTGRPDIWTYLDADEEPIRIESASADRAGADGEAAVDRIETFTAGRLTLVEEDTDRDGRVDKWERHDGPVLVSVELDADRDGKPDERISFAPDGKVTGRQKIGR